MTPRAPSAGKPPVATVALTKDCVSSAPAPLPTLSLILCSRNDEYMGNSRWRLETTLNYAAERIQALGRAAEVEIIVTDWGSEVPLRDVVRLTPAAATLVSFLTVPPTLAQSRQGDSPFPEVLALNAAVRRARGRFIGRIDQDTLVGERFLRLFFAWCHGLQPANGPAAALDKVLLFANRRNIPYRVVADAPSLETVTTFVRLFARRLPVWRENPATANLFWTSYVGIWLAHRDMWHECGGYDERLIYYNWMEADMICRLRHKYLIVDLGELVGHDFYHLEHFPPRDAWLARPHSIKNSPVDLSEPLTNLHPNPPTWGLTDCFLESAPATSLAGTAPGRRFAVGRLAWTLLRAAAAMATDHLVISGAARRQAWSRRLRSAESALAGRSFAQWPVVLWRLWTTRHSARVRRMAGHRTRWLRIVAASLLSAVNLLAAARRIHLRIAVSTSPEIRRRERLERERFSTFNQQYGAAMSRTMIGPVGKAKTALVVSSRCPTIEAELCIIKALQVAGIRPVVLLEDEQRALEPYYELAGVDKIHYWSEFLTSLHYSGAAATAVAQCQSLEDILCVTHDGVRVGQITVCTTLRQLRLGALEMQDNSVRRLLARRLAASMTATAEARRILDTVRPDFVMTDTEYTPKGELFEACLESGRNVVAYDTAHRTSTLMFKRYTRKNRDEHLRTLSTVSWARVRDLEWTDAMAKRVGHELETGYASGDWFVGPGAPSHYRAMTPSEVRKVLGLDPTKKTAVIVPHMLWDAPMMWGRPLFLTYQQWLVATVAEACRNTRVNWIIRLHPAHVWKQADEKHDDEPAEIRVLRDEFGTLPAHMVLVPPHSLLSMFSLYGVMDYCLTVRGTAGIEAARLGVPVLTAGPGRFSGLGFTVDSASRSEYLARVARIEDTPPLCDEQRKLAERFAHGMFVLRPLTLRSVTWDGQDVGADATTARRVRIHPALENEWREAPDIAALAKWFQSEEEDFLETSLET